MKGKDEHLHQLLSDLETGSQLQAVLSKLPEADSELKPLLSLAAALRTMPYPELSPAREQVLRARVFRDDRSAAVRRRFSPTWRWPSQWWPSQWRPSQWRPSRLRLAGGVAAAMLIFVLVAGLISSGALSVTSVYARSATLAGMVGRVEVAASDGQWRTAVEGERLRPGQRIRTAPDAAVTLDFFEGSSAYLEGGTDVALASLKGGKNKPLSVRLIQYAGKTVHEVVSLEYGGAEYVVETPTGSASVQGTYFNVVVNRSGQTWLAVDSGQVTVAAAGEETVLTAGQATVIQPNRPPAQPGYQFTLTGQAASIAETVWTVSGITIATADGTAVDGQLQPGSFVRVMGRVLPDGRWLADRIESAPEARQTVSFSGMIEQTDSEDWLVNGTAVQVNSQTITASSLTAGSLVRVTAALPPYGELAALRIEALGDNSPMPSLSFEPDELRASGCRTQFALDGTLFNKGSSPGDTAADVELGYEVMKGAEYVEEVALDPAGWATIAAGEQVGFTIDVRLNESWNSVPDGAEVKIRVYIAAESNRPGHHRTRVTATIIAQCGSTPTPSAAPPVTPTTTVTPTATVTPAGTITPTTTITPTVTPTPSAVITDCTGVNPHPTSTSLAERYQVTAEEIMGWFCDGLGFGEIDRGYGLSLETGKPVADIFAMRRSGLGWGQIRKQLEEQSADETPVDEDHGNSQEGAGEEKKGNQGNGNNSNQGNGGKGNGNQGGRGNGNSNEHQDDS